MGKWEKVRLGDVCIPKQWKTIATSNFTEKGYPIYGANGKIGFYSEFTHMRETILVTCRGATCGNLNICEPYSYVNGNAMALDALSDDIHLKYLYFYLLNRGFADVISGSAQPQIIKSTLQNINIFVPPLEIQQKIAATLDTAAALLKLRQQQLVELEALIQSVFYQMFGDPVRNEKGWEKSKLGDRCSIITGNTPPRNEKDNYGNFIEWIKSDNINTPNTIITTAEEYLSKKGLQNGRYVEKGCILMTCIAGSIKCIGNVAITDRRVAFNQQINGIVPKDDSTEFIYWLLKFSKAYIHSTINMSLKGILSKGKLSSLEFAFPSHELQTQFAAIVQKIDQQKALVQQSIDETQTLFDSLMSQYFD